MSRACGASADDIRLRILVSVGYLMLVVLSVATWRQGEWGMFAVCLPAAGLLMVAGSVHEVVLLREREACERGVTS